MTEAFPHSVLDHDWTPDGAALLISYDEEAVTTIGRLSLDGRSRVLPWEDPDHFRTRSPPSLVDSVETPTLVLSGVSDLRTRSRRPRCTIRR